MLSFRPSALTFLAIVSTAIDLAIRPDQMALAESSGIPFHFDFDLPPGDVYLRAGVYDPSTNRAGTLEIPEAALQSISQAPMGAH